MKKTRIAAMAIALALMASFPTFMLSLVASVLIFGSLTFVGAMLMERYGDLPGGDRRCA